jgi:RNA polymerase sigma-70 factor (ECF subfamily)
MLSQPVPSSKPAEVVPLPNLRTDAEVLRGLVAGELWAQQLLFERYAGLVERIIRRVLGSDRHTDLADVVHDAFLAALGTVGSVKDPSALPGWMRSVATNTALNCIRRRKSRSWLRFFAPEELPEPDSIPRAVDDVKEAHDRTYAILDRLPAEERVAFALRFIEGMQLREVADACRVSLATIKRRISKAEQQFVAAAALDPVLSSWLQKGDRWST